MYMKAATIILFALPAAFAWTTDKCDPNGTYVMKKDDCNQAIQNAIPAGSGPGDTNGGFSATVGTCKASASSGRATAKSQLLNMAQKMMDTPNCCNSDGLCQQVGFVIGGFKDSIEVDFAPA